MLLDLLVRTMLALGLTMLVGLVVLFIALYRVDSASQHRAFASAPFELDPQRKRRG